MASELEMAARLAEAVLLRPGSSKEQVLRVLADIEDLFEVLVRACEDPKNREVVSSFFPVLEACMAELALAARCVPPEPEEVGP